MSGPQSPGPAAEDFVGRLVGRDAEAWTRLVRRHSGHVRAVVRRCMGPDSEASDVVQDVFLCALRGIDGFRGDDAELAAWLAGIARNTALTWIRRRRSRRFVEVRDSQTTPERAANVAAPEILRALCRTRAIMARIPEQDRLPFGLRVVGGLELTEVARECNVSLATTKRRLSRARDRLERLGRRDPVLREWVQSA